MDNIETLRKSAINALKEASNLEAINVVFRDYLGKEGKVANILKNLKNMPENERRKTGKMASDLRNEIKELIENKRAELSGKDISSKSKKEFIDITAPGKKIERGHFHPLTLVMRSMVEIFQSMGFEIVFGPDVETEHYNFDALNVPEEHPARDMWDTFWLSQKSNLLLRTHTSPMQVRYMESHNPPFRIVVPGRCYRYEATDATHEIQFNQMEGLMIGKNINLSHLKGIMEVFFRNYFKNKEAEVRFRPSYFPFVEPGVEVDLRMNKKSNWLEIAGAGMVHPQVLKNVKIDPNPPTGGWQGFAFGMGIDRIAMLKYGIDDIRLLYGSDLRFIKQF